MGSFSDGRLDGCILFFFYFFLFLMEGWFWMGGFFF